MADNLIQNPEGSLMCLGGGLLALDACPAAFTVIPLVDTFEPIAPPSGCVAQTLPIFGLENSTKLSPHLALERCAANPIVPIRDVDYKHWALAGGSIQSTYPFPGDPFSHGLRDSFTVMSWGKGMHFLYGNDVFGISIDNESGILMRTGDGSIGGGQQLTTWDVWANGFCANDRSYLHYEHQRSDPTSGPPDFSVIARPRFHFIALCYFKNDSRCEMYAGTIYNDGITHFAHGGTAFVPTGWLYGWENNLHRWQMGSTRLHRLRVRGTPFSAAQVQAEFNNGVIV